MVSLEHLHLLQLLLYKGLFLLSYFMLNLYCLSFLFFLFSPALLTNNKSTFLLEEDLR